MNIAHSKLYGAGRLVDDASCHLNGHNLVESSAVEASTSMCCLPYSRDLMITIYTVHSRYRKL